MFLSKWLHQTDNVVLVPVLTGEPNIIDTLKAKGAEGVVFKRSTAPYQAGRPNSGGDQFKFKFQNTASFIVTGQNGSKNSVLVALLDESGNLVPQGKCTIPQNAQIPTTGAIVEVRYLYAYRGGCIFQPCYLGLRNDIDRSECIITQLKFKGEGTEDESEAS
jgi:bifunctional non-homologous end joining protein LigD